MVGLRLVWVMEKMIRLVYVSQAPRPFSRQELETLSGRSAEKNKTIGVTGMLLYSAGTFVQCIEGPTHAITELFARIESDARHTRVMQIACTPIKRRLFGHWWMGLLNLEEDAPRLTRDRLAVMVREAREGNEINVVKLLKLFRDALPSPAAT